MPIIFFVGQGVTPKSINYEYVGNKYVVNDFVKQLKKIDDVIVPDIPYHHVYYYQKMDVKGWREMFEPVNRLDLQDIYVESFIKNLYDSIDHKKKYVVMGHSDGVYFAMEFARLYPKLVGHIISLDGSWISTKLCKQRLKNWKKSGKKVKLIKTQGGLDKVVDKIVNEVDNGKYIKEILDHTRYEHTLECIKSRFEDIIKKIDYTVFRDFNSNTDNELDKQFNDYALEEHKILSGMSDRYEIFWLVDAGHGVWFNKGYRRQIVNYVGCL